MFSALVLALALAAPGSPAEQREVLHAIAGGSQPQVEQAINRLQFWGLPKVAIANVIHMALGDTEGSRANAAYVLSVLHPPEARKAFVTLLSEDDAGLRVSACQGLGRLKSEASSLQPVIDHLADPIVAVRRECTRAVSNWKATPAEKPLLSAFKAERDPEMRVVQVDAMGYVGGALASVVLQTLPPGTNPEVRTAAVRSLTLLGTPAGKKAVQGWCQSPAPEDRAQAVDLLSQVQASWAADFLAQLLGDPIAFVSIKASRALIDRKDKRGLVSLVVRAEKATGDDKVSFDGALTELHVPQAQRLDILKAAGQTQ